MHGNWVVYFRDMTPPKSILGKCTAMPKPIQRVKIAKAIARHTKIRDKKSFAAQVNFMSAAPTLQNLRIGSLEETEWQEQGAREAAWKLAKNVLKLKEHERATFFSPSENRCLVASTLKLEEREFVVDSGASMPHDQQKGLEWCWNGYLDELEDVLR